MGFVIQGVRANPVQILVQDMYSLFVLSTTTNLSSGKTSNPEYRGSSMSSPLAFKLMDLGVRTRNRMFGGS